MAQRPPVLKPWNMYLAPAWCALLVCLLSLTPSMLPRTAMIQAVLTGLLAALGYGLGSLLHWLFVNTRPLPEAESTQPRTAGKGSILTGGALLILGLMLYHIWQNDQREMLGMQSQSGWHMIYVVPLSAVVFALLLVISRFLRRVAGRLMAGADKLLPRRVSLSSSSLP